MDLVRYIEEMKGITEEIVDDFTDSDRIFLESEIKKLGVDNWAKFKRLQADLIKEYVSSTPSQRKKQKRFQSEYRVYIALAAYQECMSAMFMFEEVRKKHMLYDLPYRKFAGFACEVFSASTEIPNNHLWPWCDSPFDTEV